MKRAMNNKKNDGKLNGFRRRTIEFRIGIVQPFRHLKKMIDYFRFYQS